MQTGGVSLSQGGAEFVADIGEIAEISERLEPDAMDPLPKSSRTRFLWSDHTLIDVESGRHLGGWDTWRHVYTCYQGLERMGVDVEFVTENNGDDPRRIPFLVVPAYQMMSLELIRKLEDYANRGGRLIIATGNGLKDPGGHLREARIQQPIWNPIGGEIELYDHLPKPRPGMTGFGEKPRPWHACGTVVKTAQGTDSRCVYGVAPGKLPFDLPPYVFAQHREGSWTAVNHTDQTVSIPMPDSVVDSSPD